MALAKFKTLAEERVVPLTKFLSSPREYLGGIVRLVEDGDSLGVFLGSKAIDELLEDIESSSPEFIAKLEESRKSGRISSKKVERRLNL